MSSPRRCARLALRKQRMPSPEPPQYPFQPPVPPKENQKKLSNAERVKAHRERVKDAQPERYREYLAENRARCKSYRASLSVERKAKERIKSNLRVQKSRRKKKEEEQLAKPSTSRVKTPMDAIVTPQEARRAKWREQKRKQVEERHHSTRAKINDRRRLLYKQKKDAEREMNSRSVQCDSGVLVLLGSFFFSLFFSFCVPP